MFCYLLFQIENHCNSLERLVTIKERSLCGPHLKFFLSEKPFLMKIIFRFSGISICSFSSVPSSYWYHHQIGNESRALENVLRKKQWAKNYKTAQFMCLWNFFHFFSLNRVQLNVCTRGGWKWLPKWTCVWQNRWQRHHNHSENK